MAAGASTRALRAARQMVDEFVAEMNNEAKLVEAAGNKPLAAAIRAVAANTGYAADIRLRCTGAEETAPAPSPAMPGDPIDPVGTEEPGGNP